MKKFKKVLSAVLVAAFMLCCANQGTIFAAVNGTVTGTLNEKSVYGKLTCNEVGHHLAIKLIYDVRSTLNMESLNMSMEQAMDVLKIPESERSKYTSKA